MESSRFSDTVDIVLRDGSTLRVRPVVHDDAEGLRALFSGLSMDSLHQRFFSVGHSLDGEVTRLLSADAAGDVVVAGEVGDRIVAVAGYTRELQAPTRAEVAFAIANAYQGRGIGTRLLEHLAALARNRSLDHFDAFVLADNGPMLRVFLDSGFEMHEEVNAGVFHVALALDPTDAWGARAADRAVAAATASMRSFFEPRTVAVVGANRERGRIGSEVLHNIVATGYTGHVYAVHPSVSTIDGVAAFPTMAAIPELIDLAVICVPADRVLGVIDDCVATKVKAVTIITAGFAESGEIGRERERALLAKVRRAGMRLVGPNCMGLLNTDPAVRLNATFAPVSPPEGRVAMSTQSGALGLAILDYARTLHLGLSTFVSIGNKADVSSNDLLQYWSQDARTDVILLYLESFGNPTKFSQIARRVARTKPILAVKSGRSKAGARAAASHTGALASSDAVLDALFRQAGVIRTNTLEELFDAAALVANQPIPQGRRVAIVTNAGGPGILAADACEAQGLTLPPLSSATASALREFLPSAASIGNPVDMIASASAEHYEHSLRLVLNDEGIDSALVIFIPPLVTDAEDVAHAIQRAAATCPTKPVAAIFMSSRGAPPFLAPIPTYLFPEAAAVALARAAAYGEWRALPDEPTRRFDDVDRVVARAIVDRRLAAGGGWLDMDDAFKLLTAYRISTAPGDLVTSEDDAVRATERIGFPAVMKAIGADIVHKTDVGGVVLNLDSAATVRRAWQLLTTKLGAKMTGAFVQRMVTGGVEMLLGAIHDPMFGPVVAVASGGTLAELFADSQFGLPPLRACDAHAMVARLRGAALLRGFRGAPAADIAALEEAILRLSALVEACPEILELDLNPILALPRGACVLDVRVRIGPVSPSHASTRVSY